MWLCKIAANWKRDSEYAYIILLYIIFYIYILQISSKGRKIKVVCIIVRVCTFSHLFLGSTLAFSNLKIIYHLCFVTGKNPWRWQRCPPWPHRLKYPRPLPSWRTTRHNMRLQVFSCYCVHTNTTHSNTHIISISNSLLIFVKRFKPQILNWTIWRKLTILYGFLHEIISLFHFKILFHVFKSFTDYLYL